MNTYYLYDEETKEFDGAISAEEQPANGTLIPIPLGLYMPIKFDEAAQIWTGLTEDEWQKNHPNKEPKPSDSDKALAALTLQMAKQSEKQDKFNAQLLLKLAQLGGGANV